MWRIGDGWMVVAEYDPEALTMKTVLFIPGTEFMIEEMRCEAGPQGRTVATVAWRVAGVSVEGNAAVQGFFDKHWDMRMRMIEKTYNDLIAENVN